MTDIEHPWQAAPTEIISHALDHLNRASDLDHRIAFLLLDVGVETLLKIFLQLPNDVTGVEMSYTKRREYTEGSFNDLVTGVQQVAADRLGGVDLLHVNYYHSIRNKLYHEGNGVTVHVAQAEAYALVAVQLLDRLLGVVIDRPLQRQHRLVLDEFRGGAFECVICGKTVEISIGAVYVLAETLQPVCFPCGCGSEILDYLLSEIWDLDDPKHYMDREHYLG